MKEVHVIKGRPFMTNRGVAIGSGNKGENQSDKWFMTVIKDDGALLIKEYDPETKEDIMKYAEKFEKEIK